MKISACLITKNEEQNITRCIESFKDSVDEIIVVDTGSIDGTVKTAKRLGARAYYYKWNNNFSDAKNYALKQAKGQWIIFLDADEYFPLGVAGKVRSLVKELHQNKEIDAVGCRIMNIGADRNTISSGFTTRIFRNNKQIRYQGRIHEHIRKNDNLVSSIQAANDIYIYHTGYASKSLTDQKGLRNLDLLLKELAGGKASPEIHAYLALTYSGLKQNDDVIIHAEKFFQSTGYTDFGLAVDVYLKLIHAMIENGYEQKKIQSVVERAIIDFPEHPDIFYIFGQVLFGEKRYTEALSAYEKSIKLGSELNDLAQYTSWQAYLPQIYFVIGYIYELKADLTMAENYYVKSLAENKRDHKTLRRLLIITKSMSSEYLINVLKKIYNDKSVNDLQVLVHNLAQYRNQDALKYFYKIMKYRFGNDDFTSVFVLLANKQYEQAFEFFYDQYIKGNHNALLLATVSALLSGNEGIIGKLRKTADTKFGKLIDCYTGNVNGICLTDGDMEIYNLILREFTLLEEESHISCWLRLKQNFNRDISISLGDFLLDSMHFKSALEQFQEALDDGCSNRGELYFKIAYCLYRNGEYLRAAQFAKDALKNDYNKNEASELLQWIQEKLGKRV